MKDENKIVGLIIYIAAVWFCIGMFVVAMSKPTCAMGTMQTSYGYEKPISVTHAKKKQKKHRVSRGQSSCKVNPELLRVLADVSAKFGPVKVISTCRPGSVVRGTGRPSKHRNGNAVDFTTKLKGQVVSYLRANWHGGLMIYRKKSHIHIDTGRRFYAVGNY